MHFIFIWNPQFGHIGHVSMRVSEDVYISLWPKDDHNVFQYALDIKSPSKGCTYDEDCIAEGDDRGDEAVPRPPDREIEIENQLDEDAVRNWWAEAQHGGYSRSMNCITAVKLALEVGRLKLNERTQLIQKLDDCYIYFSAQCVASKGGKKEPSSKKSSKTQSRKRGLKGENCQLKTGKKNKLCNIVNRNVGKYCIGHGTTN